MQIFDFIARPLGIILSLIYNLVNSYGLAIIIFTIIIRFILLPLAVKQMKSQQEITRLQPKLREIEKRFKHDKAKVQEETMKLYKQEGVSMTGGCLPLIIQLPIIIGLYQVIYRPLAFITGLSADVISKLREVYQLAGTATEIELASAMQANPHLMNGIVDNVNLIDFNFLGINLGQIPHADFSSVGAFFGSIDALWWIPVFSVGTAIIMSIISKKCMPMPSVADNPAAAQTQKMTSGMLFIMPLMSLYFAFVLPAGVGVYWGVSNLFAAIQQFVLYKVMKPLPPIELEEEKKKAKKKLPPQKQQISSQATKQKPSSKRPPGQRPQGQQPRQPGQRTSGQKIAGQQRQPGQRPPGKKPAAQQRQPGQRPPGQKPAVQPQRQPGQPRPQGQVPKQTGKRPTTGQPQARQPQTREQQVRQPGQRPPGQKPPGQRPPNKRPAGQPIKPVVENTNMENGSNQSQKGEQAND